MEIYYYCSYKGSPVGFQIGKINYDKNIISTQNLTRDNINPFVKLCFESGLINSAFGKIPEYISSSGKYIALRKKLVTKKDGCDYNLNIAVVCSKTEFDKLAKNKSTSVENMQTLITNSMILDNSNEFGYYVDNSKLSKLLENSFNTLCNCNSNNSYDECLLTLTTKTPDLEILNDTFNLPENYKFDKNKDEQYFLKKKNVILTKLSIIIPLILLIIIVIIRKIK